MSDDELKKSDGVNKLDKNYNDENDYADFEDAIEERKSTPQLAKPTNKIGAKISASDNLLLYLSWLAVGSPMAWGLYNTLNKALQILH